MKDDKPNDIPECEEITSISFKEFIEMITGQGFDKIYKDFLKKGDESNG